MNKDTYNVFDSIKHIDENNAEYWKARKLMRVLNYSKWQNFHKVIEQAVISCSNGGIDVTDHFTNISKPIVGGKGSVQNILDYKLSRYACYLIAQNGDSRKKVIALA